MRIRRWLLIFTLLPLISGLGCSENWLSYEVRGRVRDGAGRPPRTLCRLIAIDAGRDVPIEAHCVHPDFRQPMLGRTGDQVRFALECPGFLTFRTGAVRVEQVVDIGSVVLTGEGVGGSDTADAEGVSGPARR